MKKLLLPIATSLVIGVLVSGCSAPAEGNIETANTAATPSDKPMAESAGTPEGSATAPVEDKK